MNAGYPRAVDVLIVGGGIAGAGAAFELAEFASVIVLERENRCGYHATGRSAASFTENYGNEPVRRLAMASRPFLEEPPAGFCAQALLKKRGTLTIGRVDQLEELARKLEAARALVPSIEALSVDAALGHVPVLRRDYVAGAFFEPGACELDVDALHQGFLRGARRRGAQIVVDAEVRIALRRQGLWELETTAGAFRAPLLVNAAGAWADELARLAGVAPLGLVPRKRTAFHVPPPPGMDMRAWPLVDDVGESFYFKADAGQLFVSPADATPVAAADVYADDLDVALGVERLERATTLEVGRVARSWAGLRTFAADATPVVGPDLGAEGFHWLAGQGGYGIKTSPALSRACAALIRTGRLPDDLVSRGLTAETLSPARLRPSDAPPASAPDPLRTAGTACHS